MRVLARAAEPFDREDEPERGVDRVVVGVAFLAGEVAGHEAVAPGGRESIQDAGERAGPAGRLREPGRRDHGLAAPVREPGVAREDRRAAVVRVHHERFGAPRELVEDRILRAREGLPPAALFVEEAVRVGGDLVDREEGEGLGVGSQGPLPLEGAPEILRRVVTAGLLFRVGEVAVPEGVHARRREHAAQVEPGQVGQGPHPGDLAARLGGRVPVAGLGLQAVRPPEGEQRPHAEGDLGLAAVDVAHDRQGPVADEAERALDGVGGGLVAPGREGLEPELRQALRALGARRVAVGLRRDPFGDAARRHELLAAGHQHPAPPRGRDRRHVPAVVTARADSGHGAAGEAAEAVGLQPLHAERAARQLRRRPFERTGAAVGIADGLFEIGHGARNL